MKRLHSGDGRPSALRKHCLRFIDWVEQELAECQRKERDRHFLATSRGERYPAMSSVDDTWLFYERYRARENDFEFRARSQSHTRIKLRLLSRARTRGPEKGNHPPVSGRHKSGATPKG